MTPGLMLGCINYSFSHLALLGDLLCAEACAGQSLDHRNGPELHGL